MYSSLKILKLHTLYYISNMLLLMIIFNAGLYIEIDQCITEFTKKNWEYNLL